MVQVNELVKRPLGFTVYDRIIRQNIIPYKMKLIVFQNYHLIETYSVDLVFAVSHTSIIVMQ